MINIFERFNSLNVLVIGDVMIDSYIWGKAERISPEAPVPVVHTSRKENRLGGAANVALNVQSLGGNPIICSVVGNDAEGVEFSSLLETHGLSNRGITVIKGRPTTVKTRIIANNQQVVRVDTETDKLLTDEASRLMLQSISKIIDETRIDAIIFEDYDKGLISKDFITEIVNIAREKNIITVVDPKKRNFLFYQGVTLFKPNLKELREGLEIEIDPTNLRHVEDATSQIKKLLKAEAIMLTLSEHGVYINSAEGNKLVPAHFRNIADVSGAGDTVIATAALCLASGLDNYHTAVISNLAGGLVCEHSGVVPIDKKKLVLEAEKLQ